MPCRGRGCRTFQFTPLREGRRDLSIVDSLYPVFQFTPLREGRPCTLCASAFGAISIHAPPRGATSVTQRLSLPPVFQFTPLREGRQDAGAAEPCFSHISIHAPPRGATHPGVHIQLMCVDFNSRPSARGDGKRYAISANLLFNPYKSAWLNNSATQFVEIILVIFHRIIV